MSMTPIMFYDKYRDKIVEEASRKIEEIYKKQGSAGQKLSEVQILLTDIMDRIRLKDWTKKIK